MNGGPINGGAYMPVILPTVVQMSADALNFWTSIICLIQFTKKIGWSATGNVNNNYIQCSLLF